MSAHSPALPVALDPLIAEAKRRARLRRYLVLACVVAIGAGAGGIVASRSSGQPRRLPILAAPTCRAGQLRLALRSGGVAGGTAGYGFTFTNRSYAACTLSGWPTFSLVMAGGRRVAPKPHDLIASGYSVKHPPPVPRIRLRPGESVRWTLDAADGTGLASACPVGKEILVVPPGDQQAIAVAATVFYCGPRYFWALPIGRAS